MADDPKEDPLAGEEPAPEISDKEKETAKDEEKEKDTTGGKKSKSPTAGSRGQSRTNSAVSGTSGKKPRSSASGSVRSSARGSPKARTGSSKSSISKTSRKSTPKLATEDTVSDKPAMIAPEMDESGPPEGVMPLFLSTKSQEIFGCKGEEAVTAEQPFRILMKEDIVQDMKMRAAVSDFHPVKQLMLEYPGEEVLIGYDRDFVWGQNFYVAITEEAKEKLLNPVQEGGDGVEGRETEEEEQVIYKYVPPEPKEWISLGSEREIEEESVREFRKKVHVTVHRQRRCFGEPVTFTDRNVADAKDAYIECTPYTDNTFDLKRIELDKATQAVPVVNDLGTQTDWKYPRNSNTQYVSRDFTEQEQEEHMSCKDMKDFLNTVTPRFQLALQQNEIMDVFCDDWISLSDQDGSFGSKADNHLKEYQSFTDLMFSKEKTVTCIDWHPTIRGVVAVSVSERINFDDRMDQSARIIMTPSLILIWSFTDPIHPQLLLEAPDDIYSFQFCPTDPNIIAGGCMNGQVVLWDISAHVERLKVPRSSTNKKKNPMDTLKGLDDENSLDTPIIRYAAVSSIEQSHKGAITDIQWVPDHMEVNRMGVPVENKKLQNAQIMSCAVDNCILFWDIRPPKSGIIPESKVKQPMGVPTTFRHLDLMWKPVLKVFLAKSEPGGDHSPIKFTISETQGDRSALSKIEKEPEAPAPTSGYNFGKPSSAKQQTLNSVNTHFYCGCEDGEIVYVDWMPQKDQDSGKIQTPKPDYYQTNHDGPISTLKRSPFFKDILLCVGGWTFTLWKEGVSSGPILSSSASKKRLTGGSWSPSRPSVFFITLEDGSIDMWDLLDKTHEPSLNQSVCSNPITCIFPYQVTSKQHLLAVGDNAGTLHIMEIPWSLRTPTPNEQQMMSNYLDREVARRHFVVARWDFRENEKRELEAEAKRKAGIAPNVVLTDEEIDMRMKQEYQAYLDEEASFLRELGLKDDDEPLPET